MPTKKCRCGRPIKNEVYNTCGIHDPTGYHMRAKARLAEAAAAPTVTKKRKSKYRYYHNGDNLKCRCVMCVERRKVTKAEAAADKRVVTARAKDFMREARDRVAAARKKAKATGKAQVVAVQKKIKFLKIPAGETVKIRFFGKPAKGHSHWVPGCDTFCDKHDPIRKKELHARVNTLLDMGTDVKALLSDAAVAKQNEIVPKVEQMIQANWDQLKGVRLEKGLAYATADDSYSNYRMAGGEEYIIRRMIEKCARALRRCATGKPVDMETWGDLTNMAMILGIYGKVYEKK